MADILETKSFQIYDYIKFPLFVSVEHALQVSLRIILYVDFKNVTRLGLQILL